MTLISRGSYHAGTIIYRDGSTYYAHKRSDNTQISGSTAQSILQDGINNAGKVFICDATYPLTSALTAPSNTEIECESYNTLIQGAGSHTLITNSDWAAGNSNITVRGGTWDANNGTSVDGGINFDNVDYCTIEGVKSINSSAENIKVRNGAYTKIIGNYCNKSALVGGTSARACINSATGSGYTVIANNICIDAYGEAIGVFRSYATSVSVTGNVCRITTDADSPIRRGHILIEGANTEPTQQASHIAITGNVVEHNYEGIHLMSAKNCTVTGNVVKGFNGGGASLNGIRSEGAGYNITIVGNTVEFVGLNGIVVEDTCRRVTVADNVVNNASQTTTSTYDGILFQPRGGDMRDITVTGNVVMSDATAKIRSGFCFDLDTRTITKLILANNELAGNTGVPITYMLGTTGAMNLCEIYHNVGISPIGNVANPFNDTNSEIGLAAHGSSSTFAATPTTGTTYTAVLTDLLITSVGGTVSAIQIIGPSANEIVPNGGSAVTTLAGYYLPRGYGIKWTHTGAPTVKVHAV